MGARARLFTHWSSQKDEPWKQQRGEFSECITFSPPEATVPDPHVSTNSGPRPCFLRARGCMYVYVCMYVCVHVCVRGRVCTTQWLCWLQLFTPRVGS